MTDEFYLAAVPEPRTILGLRLRPLSLGHLLLLHRVKSAFVTADEGEPAYHDLALSVLICSQTWEQNIATFDDQDLPEFMRRWHDQLTGADSFWVKIGFRKFRPIDLQSKCLEFADYLKEGSKIPDYDFNPGDFRELAVPSIELIKVTLMRDLHISESEILDRSWALCLWDHVVLKALNNEVKMYGRDAKEQALAAAEQLAENIKSGKFHGNS